MGESDEQFLAQWGPVIHSFNAWANQVYQRASVVIQALAPLVPKQKIVNRRSLSARRARRRTERRSRVTR